MNNELKKQLIFESFDVLKDSWEDKDEAIKRLICNMFNINSDASIEMWLYILQHNKSTLKDLKNSYNASYLVERILDSLFYEYNHGNDSSDYDNDNECLLYNLVFQNKALYELIYKTNVRIGNCCCYLLSHLIVADNPKLLQEILNLLISNKKDESFGHILSVAIDHIPSNQPVKHIELLEEFVAKISNKQDRAEAFTALLLLGDKF